MRCVIRESIGVVVKPAMLIRHIREYEDGKVTTGRMSYGSRIATGSWLCRTLEDRFNLKKVMHETRIPAGEYRIKLRTVGGMHKRYARKFTWHRGMLWLQEVLGFTYIYIHPGVTRFHTSGCILVGRSVYRNPTSNEMVLGTDGYATYKRLYMSVVDAAERDDLRIIIENKFDDPV